MQVDLDDEEGLEVQMAPLIDCVFLLLIFFLVASTMKKLDKELPVDLPVAGLVSVNAPKADDLLIIGVDAAGQTYIGTEPVTNSMLHQRIKQTAAEAPARRVRLDADQSADFVHVLRVLDLLSFEGLDNVGIHLRKPDDTK
ncbi:MAG: biopolymer transporter ExbD [Planctomycetota bacterium]|jgi:biopolymer transport protein ExbD|nr:biopolymer transporter ExbD [Planctomycetota bacterium]